MYKKKKRISDSVAAELKALFMLTMFSCAFLSLYLSFEENVKKAGIALVCETMPVVLLFTTKKAWKYILADLDLIFAYTAICSVFEYAACRYLNLWHIDKFLIYYQVTFMLYIAIMCTFVKSDYAKNKDERENIYKMTQKFLVLCLCSGIGGQIAAVGYFGKYGLLTFLLCLCVMFVSHVAMTIVAGMSLMHSSK